MGNAKNINDIFARRAVVMSSPDASWPLPAELMGVEIEVEDFKGDASLLRPDWTTHKDASLRDGGIEFVLSSPLGGKQLTRAISNFFNAGYRYTMGERTSVHIHINASDNMTVDQFRNMFLIMFLIEPAIFRWADENRKWCGYCCPLTDLDPERIAGLLAEQNDNDAAFMKSVKGGDGRERDPGRVNPDRYYGFNFSAYAKHGTVEFRYFPCTTEEKMLVDWVKMVMCVKRAALAAPEPADFLRSISTRNLLENFIDSSFPEAGLNQVIRDRLDFDDAAARVNELLNVLLLSTQAIRRGGMYAQRSQGMMKLLNSSFPRVAKRAEAQDAYADARTATAVFKKYSTFADIESAEFDIDALARNAASATVPTNIQAEYNRLNRDVLAHELRGTSEHLLATGQKKLRMREIEARYPRVQKPRAGR